MDFEFSEEQEALRGVARQILETEVTAARLTEVEGGQHWFDERTWHQLAKANLVGLTVPEGHGGNGLGVVETCILLEQVGRTVAPVPVLSTLLGALAIATFGTEEQQRAILPKVASGDSVIAIALSEPGVDDLSAPSTVAVRDGEAWRIDGTKLSVASLDVADLLLVPASTADGPVVCLVDPKAAGVELSREIAVTGEPLFDIRLSGVLSEGALAGPGIAGWLADRVLVGMCAIEAGVADRAIEMTAAYSSGRVQFGRPLGSFQAVQQRAADAFIDVLCMRWTMWYAAWLLDEGLPAADEVAVAKFWAADGGHRVVSAAVHLHGGVGVDLSYPLHRYFSWSKQIEATLGTGTRQLVRLGRSMVAEADAVR